MLKLFAIRLNKDCDIFNSNFPFSNAIRDRINNYRKVEDKIIAFASAYAKFVLLPAVIGVELSKEDFCYTDNGKPFLINYPNIKFSISHCWNYLCMAITTYGDIGVDIEKISQPIDLVSKNLVFSEAECNLIKCPHDYIKLWTKKEAYLKYTGEGFIAGSYKYTNLNCDTFQNLSDAIICTSTIFNDYMLSICLSNSKK